MKKATIIFGEPIFIQVKNKDEFALYTELLNDQTQLLAEEFQKNNHG